MIHLNVRRGGHENQTSTIGKSEYRLEADGAVESQVMEAGNIDKGTQDNFISSIHEPKVTSLVKEYLAQAEKLKGESKDEHWKEKQEKAKEAGPAFDKIVQSKLPGAASRTTFDKADFGEWKVCSEIKESDYMQTLMVTTGTDKKVMLVTQTHSSDGPNFVHKVEADYRDKRGYDSVLLIGDLRESMTAWEVR